MIWLFFIFQNRESQRIVNMSDESIQKVSKKYFIHLFPIDDYVFIICYDGYIVFFIQQRDRDLLINMSSSSIQKVSIQYFIQLFIIDDYFVIKLL